MSLNYPAMSTRSALLVGLISAVLAFAAGHQIAQMNVEPEGPPSRTYAPAADLKLEGVASQARAILLNQDRLQRTADLTALLQKLGPASLDDLKTAYGTIFLDFGDTDLVFFAEWWARFDPAAAFSWTQEQTPTEHPAVVTAVLRAWARTDPAAALKKSQVVNPKARSIFTEACLVGWEESGSPGLLEFVESLPVGADRQRAIQVVARRKVLRDGPDAAFAWAEDLPDSSDAFKLNVLRRIASTAAEVDPASAAKWAESLFGGEFERGIPQRVGTRWARRDPRAAMEWLSTLTPGRNRDDGVRETFRKWLREDPDVAMEYASTVELEPWLDPMVARVAKRHLKDDPMLALDWASKVTDEDLRLATTGIVARAWVISDEPAARAWVEQAGLPDYLERKIFEIPDSMRPGAMKRRREERKAAQAN